MPVAANEELKSPPAGRVGRPVKQPRWPAKRASPARYSNAMRTFCCSELSCCCRVNDDLLLM